MRIASEPDGVDSMVRSQSDHWQSTKRAAFTREMPSAQGAEDGADGGELRSVQVDGPSKVHKDELNIMSSPAVRCGALSHEALIVNVINGQVMT